MPGRAPSPCRVRERLLLRGCSSCGVPVRPCSPTPRGSRRRGLPPRWRANGCARVSRHPPTLGDRLEHLLSHRLTGHRSRLPPVRERGAVFRRPALGGDSVPAAGRDGVREALLGNECLPNRCSCPSVRAVNRWNLLRVQLLGDLLQRHPLPEHRVDLHPPYVVTSVAEPMREPDVVGGEVTSVHLESRIVVGRRLPIGIRADLGSKYLRPRKQ